MAAWRNWKTRKKTSTEETGTSKQNPPVPGFADAVAKVTSGAGDQTKAFEDLVAATKQAGCSLSELAEKKRLEKFKKAMLALPPQAPPIPKPPVSIVRMFYVDEDGMYQGEREILLHPESQCIGRKSPCCIHSPSPNHMNQWPMLHNARNRGMFRRCEHGVWHPDFDHLSHIEMRSGYEKAEKEAAHDCCSYACCERIFF
jgi:hypothetical protein